jgi:simple sugar transport system permease protein
MQANVGVPVEIVLVIQALVVLFIAAPDLVKRIFRLRNLQAASATASKGWNG